MTYIGMLFITIPLAYIWQMQVEHPCLLQKFEWKHKYNISVNKNLWTAVAFIPIYFIYAFQYSLHSDYDNYEKTFLQIKSGTGKIREIGVHYINKFVANSGLDFQFVYIIIYLIAFLVLAKCIMDYSEDYAVSLVLFITIFFTLGFLQLRQLVAVIFSLYSYRFIAKKNLGSFLLTIGIACLFHVSAIIMLPAYFILGYDFSLTYYLIASGLFAVLDLMKENVLVWLVQTFLPSYYGRHEMFRNLALNKWDAIFIMALLFLCAIYYKRVRNRRTINGTFMNGLFMYVIIFFFGRWIFEFDRFGYYFYFPMICLVPNMISCEKNTYFRWLLKISVCFSAIAIFIIKYHANELFCYASIWG